MQNHTSESQFCKQLKMFGICQKNEHRIDDMKCNGLHLDYCTIVLGLTTALCFFGENCKQNNPLSGQVNLFLVLIKQHFAFQCLAK